VKKDVSQTHERRAGEQNRERWKERGHRERERHRRAAEEHRVAHAEAVGDPSRVHREDERKGRIQRAQQTDGEGARAEIERIERERHLAAALGDRREHRRSHDEVQRQPGRSPMQDTILDGGDEYTERIRNASRAKRSLSLRKRPEIQEMPRRGHRRSVCGYEGMRNLHGLLRRLGGRHGLRHEMKPGTPCHFRGEGCCTIYEQGRRSLAATSCAAGCVREARSPRRSGPTGSA
jgi:hypothetical protein